MINDRRRWAPAGAVAGLLVAIAGIAVLIPRSVPASIAAAGGLLVAALVVGLHVRGRLHPWWPFAILAVLMPLNGLRPIAGASYGDIALILAGVALLPFVRRSKPPGQLYVALLGTLIITAGGLLGMAAVQDTEGLTELAKFVLGAPMVLVIVMLLNPTPSQAVFLLKFYSLGATLSALATVNETVDPRFQRAIGFGAHMGHLGVACLIGVMVMIGWFIETRRVSIKILTAVVAVINVYGITQTGTRSVMLGLIVALLFVALCARFIGMAVLAGGAFVGAVAYFTIVPYLPNAEGIRRIFGQGELAGLATVSANEHNVALFKALELIADHPLVGAGFSQGLVAHNLILQVASVGGLIALVGLFLIWGMFGLMVVQRLNLGISRDTAIKTCVMAGVLGYFVFAMFQPLIWDRHLWFVIALTLIIQTPHAPQLPTRPLRREVSDEPVLV